MIKYAKIINNETGLCEVGTSTNHQFYLSIGMTGLDVQQSDIDGQWYLKDKCPMKTEEEKEQQEQEALDMCVLTATDVERAIYKVKDMDFEDILEYVKSNYPEIDAKALKIELKANHFYRGNPWVNQIGTLLGFTKEQLNEFFKTGNYEALEEVEEVEE